MRRKATQEELEENSRQIMSEHPNVTREMIAEWDKIGTPTTADGYQEHRRERARARSQKKNPI